MSQVTTKSFSLVQDGERNTIRMRLVHLFAKEKPGKGKKDLASRYIYFVETLQNGSRIYLQRPANLHNGFDFLICIEKYNFAATGKRKRNYPKHEDIINDLKIKKSENPEMYRELYAILKQVHSCHEISDESYASIQFHQGFPVDMIIKIIKWLFIEQDIRYWNYSGRDMLWSGVPQP